ncbi:hypothetical protein DXB24_06070 [Lachnospiraceae bacterium OM02-3]|nr:hypothetical protein DXB24_06070 [Lachnospiraceae bacterium OM02-3]
MLHSNDLIFKTIMIITVFLTYVNEWYIAGAGRKSECRRSCPCRLPSLPGSVLPAPLSRIRAAALQGSVKGTLPLG